MSQDSEQENNTEVLTEEIIISKKCGIVMPISSMDGYPESHWKDIRRILESAIREAGFEARIVSESDDIGVIHKRIVQNLYENPMIVCDISGRNPNVMFELGLRLAFDKPTIIIKDDATQYSFDTSVIEHLSYPKDLRHHKIDIFKDELKDRIEKTYKTYLKNPENYSTFLKNFGDFKTPIINEETVSVDKYMLDEIKGLRSSVQSLSRSIHINSQFEVKRDAHKMTLINDTRSNIHDVYNRIATALNFDNNLVFSRLSGNRIDLVGNNSTASYADFENYVKMSMNNLSYEMKEVGRGLYSIDQDIPF